MSDCVSPEARYRASESFLLREIGGESILVPLDSAAELGNSMISLNDTFRFVWDIFQTPHTIPEAVQAAQAQYDDPSGEIERDIYGVVQQGLPLGLFVEE